MTVEEMRSNGASVHPSDRRRWATAYFLYGLLGGGDMFWGSRYFRSTAVACLLAGAAGLSGCGNDGELQVRPPPPATAVASPTASSQAEE